MSVIPWGQLFFEYGLFISILWNSKEIYDFVSKKSTLPKSMKLKKRQVWSMSSDNQYRISFFSLDCLQNGQTNLFSWVATTTYLTKSNFRLLKKQMCGQIFGHGYLQSKHTKIEKQTKVRTNITDRSTKVPHLNIFR